LLGQPVYFLTPDVVGFELTGRLREGVTATDLVLTVTEILRRHKVVGKFVEFFGEGTKTLTRTDRATIANMAPEYGATMGFFPVDEATIDYFRGTGRSKDEIDAFEAYFRAQNLFGVPSSGEIDYTNVVALDLGSVAPSLAGPKRPQDRIEIGKVKNTFADLLSKPVSENGFNKRPEDLEAVYENADGIDVRNGDVLIAAITSCTNTSNPSVMVAAGLLAKKAVERGLKSRPWVKTSLAPGSKVVTSYLAEAGLTPYLEHLGFHLVGYGCTTCIGNSGPLPDPVRAGIEDGHLVAVSVLSGNRNFEGRIHPDVRANYLASPPLVVAYALAGRIDADLQMEPLGTGSDGQPVFLREVWPSQQEVTEVLGAALRSEMFHREYADVFTGDERWRGLPVPAGETYAWDAASTYVKHPPYFEGMTLQPPPVEPIRGARVLALLGDSVTTDHISPAGAIKLKSPAGQYLVDNGVAPRDFNSYGARRGNHEVMVRGTFANVRLRNKLVPDVEGGVTIHLPDGEQTSIFDASLKYQQEGVPLIVIAGKEYGTGSSRDWAAKGPRLLGVRAVIAESFERIHRSNLVGMGVLPLEYLPGDSADVLALTGREVYEVQGLEEAVAAGRTGFEVTVHGTRPEGGEISFRVRARLDTPEEVEYYRHGGILQYVLRQLART
jgi:aconitate hydratase